MKETLPIPRGLEGAVWRHPVRPSPLYQSPHQHDELELNVVLSGRARYVVGRQPVDLSVGDALWLFPTQVHGLVERTPDFSTWVVVASPRLLELACTSETTRAMRNQAAPAWLEVARLSAEGLGWLDHRLVELGVGEPARFNAGLAYVLLSAWAACTSERAVEQQISPVVVHTLRLLEESPQRWSVPALARAVGVSTGHLSRVVRAQTGRSVVEHLHQQQVTRFLDLYVISVRTPGVVKYGWMHERDSTMIRSTTAASSSLSCWGAACAAAAGRRRPEGRRLRTQGLQRRLAGGKARDLALQVPQPIGTDGLRQPARLEGAQVPVDGRAALRQGGVHPGQFRLPAGMDASQACRARLAASADSSPSSKAAGTSATIASSSGSAGSRSWSQRAVPCRWRA